MPFAPEAAHFSFSNTQVLSSIATAHHPSFTTGCHPSFLVACHPSIAAANHPSHLLAILPLLVILHYLPSFAATCHLLLTSIVVLSQSFTATSHPSFTAAWPLPTMLLSCSRSFPNRDLPLPAFLCCYAPSCANIYSRAFPILLSYWRSLYSRSFP